MFLRRRPEADNETKGASSTLTMLRDIVEIVAIVAAGIWAFYTFVYANTIVPASIKPEAQIESSLTMLGQRKGLIAVQSHIAIRNDGATPIWLYGFAETVVGSNVGPRAMGEREPNSSDPTYRLERPGWITSQSTRVFGFAFLTTLADSRSKRNFNLRPGQSVPVDHTFYVPVGRYDELQTHVALSYAARATPVRTRFVTTSDRIVHLESATNAEVDSFDLIAATLSLWRN